MSELEEQPKPAELPKPGVISLQHVDLAAFERLVYGRDPERAGVELLQIVRLLKLGGGFAHESAERQQVEPLRGRLYTRLAAAITALFADPAFQITEEGFGKFALAHPVFGAIFAASAYGSSDHIVRLLASNPEEEDPDKLQFADRQNLAKMFAIWTSNSAIGIKFEQAFGPEGSAKFLFPWWLGMISDVSAIDPKVHERREALLGMGEFFAKSDLKMDMLGALSDAYMHCSYASRPDKHDVKRVLGRIANRAFASKCQAGTLDGLAVKGAARRPLSEKPVIMFPLEWWTSFHAMYRCYAPVVEQLREKFRCVAYTRPSQTDEQARKSFDDVIELPEKDTVFLDVVIAEAKKLKPDVVYYLSSGMALWWVAIAQTRLAPLQMLTLGHPATTMSPAIDYALVEEGLAPEADAFSERILELPPNALRFVNRADQETDLFQKMRELRDSRPRMQNLVKVAVPAMVAKLGSPFLDCIRRVAERAAKEKAIGVQFHFFPNQLGVGIAAAEMMLRQRFPGCVVRERTSYEQYLRYLAECDLHASPFPFGGTNSNVDSLALGIPVIVLEGPREPHERYDAAMIRRMGAVGLIASSVEDYESLLFKFVTGERSISISPDSLGVFFDPLKAPAAGAFARAIEFVYQNHHQIRQRPKEKRVRWQEYTP